jgi:hypothetical protein
MAVAPEHGARSSFGSRRNAVTAVASAVAAVALAVAVAGRSCDVDNDSPRAAARDFATVASAGDRSAVFRLLGPETQKRLEQAAKRATDLVGGSRRYSPLDMISISRSSDTPPPNDFILRERSESRATVEIVSASGERARVQVVKVGGQWRIELPSYRPSP